MIFHVAAGFMLGAADDPDGVLFWNRMFGIGILLLFAGAIAAFLLLRKKVMGYDAPHFTSAAPGTTGTVRFVFTRYSGLLVHVTSQHYDTTMDIAQAHALMRKIIRHNLTWGLLAAGGVFVPFFTLVQWRRQRARLLAAREGFPVQPRQD